MKILVLLMGIFYAAIVSAAEPERVDDWTLSAPFTYGLSKGLTFGLYDAKQPTIMVKAIPETAEMPLGLVQYVEKHNRFATTVGMLFGVFFSLVVAMSVLYGGVLRIRMKTPCA